ncbi:uncharacterized protein TRUGW13939_07929 [Talaromyces rugulosus]|uniref:Peptidase S33 tripeptidyl aminopeptidase-like C-terminal domain-containing protein n=1 Tax=Talaromyces rugulosus TaxID=121627 RepID=A0A7H8R7N6_TALRU|nr:uncharacterized protein TRUGW13939_07929 [Talaromyces rugulosus]QKX60783.1 hypothetical protein TRUGW13939_07929 [Talaromyces rugulosus]
MRKPTLQDIFFAAWLVDLTVAAPLQESQSIEDFDWSSITPTEQLEYHQCGDGYKCARLKVPLDWTNASNSSQSVAIAIVTLPATVPNTDPSFGGTILINPGGPSGSGTDMAIELGHYLQGVVDGERHYEILGFDPRGVAFSTPRADCYNGNEIRRTADQVQAAGIPSPDSGSTALNYLYQSHAAVSELCAEAGDDSIFAHMSTASVARDMLEIVDRVNELKHNSSTRANSEEPKLQYLGVSYGTFLGNTFASMFPNRVGRMVIDGVEDPHDYIKGTWEKNLNDFEKVLDHFYQTCFEAGSDCLLKKDSDKNASAIRERIDSFLSSLENSPVPTVYEGRTRLVTSLLVRTMIHDSLYDPINRYDPLSALLASSLTGDHTLLLQNSTVELESACQIKNETYPANYTWANDAGSSILCGDSAFDAGDRNITWARDLVDFLYEQSPTAGEDWTKLPLCCIGWKYKPNFVFRGPFGSSMGKNNTSNAPLLVLSTRYDHATPLANAFAVSKSHAGSTVVVQESWGHTALLTSRSNCTAGIVKEYFATGKLPQEGTVCEQDCVPSIPLKPCPGLPGYA